MQLFHKRIKKETKLLVHFRCILKSYVYICVQHSRKTGLYFELLDEKQQVFLQKYRITEILQLMKKLLSNQNCLYLMHF